MAVYDSEKIRSVATAIKQLTETMRADVYPKLRATNEYRECFRGKTARAMEERLDEFLHTARVLEEDMRLIARRIDLYANLLEEADNQLANEL